MNSRGILIAQWLKELALGVTVGIALGATLLGFTAVTFFNSDMEPWWAGIAFGAVGGLIGTVVVFLIRALRFAASKIKQALRRH